MSAYAQYFGSKYGSSPSSAVRRIIAVRPNIAPTIVTRSLANAALGITAGRLNRFSRSTLRCSSIDKRRRQQIVILENEHVIGCELVDADVVVFRDAEVHGVPHVPNTARGIRQCDVSRIVRRTVVNDDDLVGGARLTQRA